MLQGLDRVSKSIVVLSICLGLFFIGLIIYQQFLVAPKLNPGETAVQNEFSRITQMFDVKKLSQSSIVKPEVVSVGGTFKTDASFDAISHYYLTELAKLGWQFKGVKKITVWGKDYGGKVLTFTKGQYKLVLDFPGNDPEFNYTFSEDLNWHP